MYGLVRRGGSCFLQHLHGCTVWCAAAEAASCSICMDVRFGAPRRKLLLAAFAWMYGLVRRGGSCFLQHLHGCTVWCAAAEAASCSTCMDVRFGAPRRKLLLAALAWMYGLVRRGGSCFLQHLHGCT